MENNHDAFLASYSATRFQKEKKQLLKTYMLSLSSDDLDSFIFNNLDKLEHKIKTAEEKNSLTEIDKKEIIKGLEDLTLVITTKTKREKAA